MENNQKILTPLFKLLNEVKNKLPHDDINNIMEFIENNEPRLAYETLCTQLYEYNIPISNEFYKRIVFWGQLSRIHPPIWLLLKELIKD